MRHLFVYGSLMFDEVWGRLVKTRYEKLTTELHGYRRLKVKGDFYPGLVKSGNAITAGVLILNVKQQDISTLDRFEGEYYKRVSVEIVAKDNEYRAEVYLFKNKFKHLLTNTEWDVHSFREKNIQLFLARYRGF